MAAAGDIACDADWKTTDTQCQHEATAKLAEQINPDMVLALGDLHYTTDEIDDWSGYDQSWGKFKSITRPVPGNHEYIQSKDAQKYFEYWGDAAGGAGGGWYSFDKGDWHFVALNSNCGEAACGEDGKQGKWLKEDLKANRLTCTLAFMHQPRYSSGKQHGDGIEINILWQILKENGVDVVLAGHEHNYERMYKDGIWEFVVGTGGRSLYEFGPAKPGSEIRLSEFGILKLELGDDAYKWQFIAIDGTIKDRGEGNCL